MTGSSVRNRQLTANHDNNNELNNAEPIGLALDKFLSSRPGVAFNDAAIGRRRRTNLT